jgi:hypothetical protein
MGLVLAKAGRVGPSAVGSEVSVSLHSLKTLSTATIQIMTGTDYDGNGGGVGVPIQSAAGLHEILDFEIPARLIAG